MRAGEDQSWAVGESVDTLQAVGTLVLCLCSCVREKHRDEAVGTAFVLCACVRVKRERETLEAAGTLVLC